MHCEGVFQTMDWSAKKREQKPEMHFTAFPILHRLFVKAFWCIF